MMRFKTCLQLFCTVLFACAIGFPLQAASQYVGYSAYWDPDGNYHRSDSQYVKPPCANLISDRQGSEYADFTAEPETGWSVDYWCKSKAQIDLWNEDIIKIQGSEGKLVYTQYFDGTGDIYLGVRFSHLKYDLVYDGNGAVSPARMQDVVYTNKYSLEDAPIAPEGMTFAGWSDVSNNVLQAGQMVSGNSFLELDDVHIDGRHDVKLTAIWTTNSYTVTFDPNGGSVTPASKVVAYGQPYGDLPTPEKEGFAFSGWYAGDNLVTAETVMLTAANHTLAAKWNEKVTVTFHWKNADGTSASETQSVVKGGSATPPSNLPQRTGYDFVRWEGNYTNVQANTDVNAVYERWQFLVEFFTDGDGSGTVLPISMEYGYGEELKVIATADESSEFAGWDDGVQESNRIVAVIAPTNYTATFTLKRFDVTFNWKTGANVVTQETQRIAWGAAVTPPADAVVDSRIGYSWTGWDVSSDEFVSVKSNLTVNANYEPHKFKVSYDLSGVETNYVWTEKNPQDFIYDVPQKLLFPASCQSADGFDFWAWKCNGEIYEMPIGTEDVMVSNLTAEADGVVTMKAVWDVGDLSRAMKCDNLYWREAEDYPGWKPGEESAVWHGNEFSADMVAQVKTNGVLSFDWKVDQTPFIGSVDLRANEAILTPKTRVEREGWVHMEFEVPLHAPADQPDPSYGFPLELRISFENSNRAVVDGYVANVTWIPADSHPDPHDPDDAVTISSVEIAGNKFKVSFTSDAKFDYNLLTNANLLIDSWGVWGERKVGDGKLVTFGPEILPGVPQMFYKIETIRKK